MIQKHGILLGFIYPNSSSPLRSNLVDLYQFYRYIDEVSNFDKIDVIMDLNEDPHSHYYSQIIRQGHVNANILGFITHLKEKNRHHYIEKSDDIATFLDRKLSEDNNGCYFIYMTGHGQKEGLVCCDGSLKWTRLQNIFFERITPSSEALIVLDVCHGWHLELPYCLVDDYLSLVNDSFFPQSHLALITTFGEKAASTNAGSIVSRSLVHLFNDNEDRYQVLLNAIRKELISTSTRRDLHLDVRVYTSYPSLYRIWPWFWPKHNEDIKVFTQGCFIRLSSPLR